MRFTLLLSLFALSSAPAAETEKLHSGDPIKALLVTGGCCHNYLLQTILLTQSLEKYADITWTIERDPRTGTAAQIDLYDDPDWAKPYDVIVHNECFATTVDPEYIHKITEAHKAGAHAVVIHCAMHTYRDTETDEWRAFLGVTSKKHDHQSNYPVKIVNPDHPVMKGFPTDWTTAKDELYIIEKLWPTATTLATSTSEITKDEHPVAWVNQYGKARVFGTSYGHSDDSFRDPNFITLIARGLIWASGK